MSDDAVAVVELLAGAAVIYALLRLFVRLGWMQRVFGSGWAGVAMGLFDVGVAFWVEGWARWVCVGLGVFLVVANGWVVADRWRGTRA